MRMYLLLQYQNIVGILFACVDGGVQGWPIGNQSAGL